MTSPEEIPQEAPPDQPQQPAAQAVAEGAEEQSVSLESFDMDKEQAAIEQEIIRTRERLQILEAGFEDDVTRGVQEMARAFNIMVVAIRDLGGDFEGVKEEDVRALITPHQPYYRWGMDPYHVGPYQRELYQRLRTKEMPDYDESNWEKESSENYRRSTEIYERVQAEYVDPIMRASGEITDVNTRMERERTQLDQLEQVREDMSNIRKGGLMAFLRKNAAEKLKSKK